MHLSGDSIPEKLRRLTIDVPLLQRKKLLIVRKIK